ncbi:unnamed protein product, partial [Ectocarpus sp. 8 AP-2014]
PDLCCCDSSCVLHHCGLPSWRIQVPWSLIRFGSTGDGLVESWGLPLTLCSTAGDLPAAAAVARSKEQARGLNHRDLARNPRQEETPIGVWKVLMKRRATGRST